MCSTNYIYFVLNEFLDPQNLLLEYNFIILGSIVLEIWLFIPNDGHCGGHLEYPQNCGSHQIYFVLVEFLDPKNLPLEYRFMFLCLILLEIQPFISYGGHLGGHLEYLKMLKGAKLAFLLISTTNHQRTIICKKTSYILHCKVHPQICQTNNVQEAVDYTATQLES